MLCGLLTIERLVEQPIADADDAVASDHPILRVRFADAQRLRSGKLVRYIRGSGEPALHDRFVDVRPHHAMIDACSGQQLPADLASGGEDQAQLNNLVEKGSCRPSADLGACSTETIRATPPILVQHFIPGDEISSPACESREQPEATRGSFDKGAPARLLANAGALPKPRCPPPNHIINLLLNYI